MNTWKTNCYDTQSWFYMWFVREARKHILAGKAWKIEEMEPTIVKCLKFF
jgi:hypothetical protein